MKVAAHVTALGLLLTGATVLAQESGLAQPLAGSATVSDERGDARDDPATSSPDAEALLPTIPVDAAPPPEAERNVDARPRNRIVEEIVVTAQKREENIQDVPISMAAFGGEALDVRGIYNVADLQQVTAGLQFGSFAGYPLIYLRGVGTDVFLPSADPSVTTYIDGIYVPSSQGVIQGFGGIERVEVLKGPQGTLFGRNSTGGAISIVTKKPGDSFAASAQVVAGNYDERRAKIYLSGPLTGWFGASLDLLYSEVDHQYRHVEGLSIGPEQSLAGRVRVNFHPTDSFDVDVSYLDVDNEGSATQVAKNFDPSLIIGLPIQPQRDDFVLETDHVGRYEAAHELLTAAATWKLPWFDAKLIGSDQTIKSFNTSFDFDGSPLPVAVFSAENQFTEAQTAELQLLSNGGWGGEALEWVLGAYYLESRAGVDPGSFAGAPGILEFLDLPQQLIDLLGAVGVNPNDGLQLKLIGTMGTRSMSGYLQGTWHALDWLDFTLGGRYQTEERQLLKTQTELITTPERSIPVLRFPLRDASYTNFSPKAVISVKPRDDWMFYLSAAQGFKSGTFNVVTLYSPGSYVDPEEVTTVDLGLKCDFFDGRLRLNGAVFRTWIQDLHAAFISLTNGGAVTFENAGEAEIAGAEFDLTLVPMPDWNPGLILSANGAYLDSEYTEFPNGSGFDEQTGLFVQNQDFSGNTVVRSPEWTGGVGFSQVFELPWDGEVELAADWYYNSGFYYDAQNSVEEGAYALLNARIGYFHRPWNLRATLVGRNLLDEQYHLAILQDDFGQLSTLAYEAQLALQVNWAF